MRRYFQVFTVTLKEYFAYRLNFVLWRFRMILSTRVTLFLWMGVFDSRSAFGSYSKERLLSYLLFSSLVTTFISSSRISNLAYEIQSGGIMNLLLKPLSIFGYYAATDAADKLMNIFFGIIEFIIIVFSFKIPLVPPQQVGWFLVFLCSGVCISFSINLMLSFIGFWTPDVWAPRFLFMMLVTFVSGAYFPLDLLPSIVYRIFLFTPFPYLYFMPTKILVDGIQNTYFIQQLICSLGWAIGLFFLARFLWKKGIKNFSFWGR
ncbi:MAG: ABC-2 family transporter protein [Candidatus Roizmanbacteria bacterium]|nr:ABC-2 family transporter protein [Candidatus Roizmanbacteria bacterium]